MEMLHSKFRLLHVITRRYFLHCVSLFASKGTHRMEERGFGGLRWILRGNVGILGFLHEYKKLFFHIVPHT